jgi:transcriptional regulator with XRE-family HTH domain
VKVETMTLGERLRELRVERKLTLGEVAEAAQISKSYLSNLENDRSNPSLSILKAITNHYQVPLAALFEYTASKRPMTVVRKNQRKTYRLPDSAVQREFLSPNVQGKLEAVLTIAERGETSGTIPFVHDGEEFGLILEGCLKYYVGNETCVLEEGDSIYFDCSLPHGWENIGDGVARAIWVLTPPSF